MFFFEHKKGSGCIFWTFWDCLGPPNIREHFIVMVPATCGSQPWSDEFASAWAHRLSAKCDASVEGGYPRLICGMDYDGLHWITGGYGYQIQ